MPRGALGPAGLGAPGPTPAGQPGAPWAGGRFTRRAAPGRDGLVTLELQTGIVQRQAKERAGRSLV
jgi:hypothetical protein